MTTRQVAIRVQTEGKAEVKRDWQEIGKSGAGAQQQIASATDQANAAADRQMAKWQQMARAAKEQEAIASRQAKINATLGVGAGSGKSARDSAEAMAAALAEREVANDVMGKKGLSAMQRNTLIYTASDIFASAASGISPGMIAMQQGPQVLQAFAVGGDAASASMLKLFGILGTGAAVVGTLTAAWISHRDAVAKLDVTAQGLAVTSGLTGEQLDALARKSASLGEITVGSARTMAAAYLSTGRIGGDVTQTLIGLTQRYAVATGQDAKKATEDLALAMAKPAQGADTLNAKLHFLDDATVRYIQSLVSQNQTTEAQSVLAQALTGKLDTVASHVTILGGVWDSVKMKASQAWDAMGRAVDFLAHNQTDLQRLAELDARRSLRPQSGTGMLTNVAPAWWAQEDQEAAQIRARLKAAKDRSDQAVRNSMAEDARAAQGRINPRDAQLRGLQQDRSTIKTALDNGALADPEKARKDLAALDREIAAVSAGYASAAAQAAALKTQQTSAATEARKAAAEAKKHAEEQERYDDLTLRNKLTIAKLGGDKATTDELERQLRIRELIHQFEQAGVASAKAKALAERQVGQEMVAWYDAYLKKLQEDGKDIVSMADRLKGVVPVINENEAALKELKGVGEQAFDAITDPRNWNNWRDVGKSAIQDIIAELFKLSAVNPLKNLLFSQSNPTLSGGILGAIFGGKGSGLMAGDTKVTLPPNVLGGKSIFSTIGSWLFGHNADGTDNWRGGPTWVGERGPELLIPPQGSKIISNARSAAMTAGPTVTIHMDARGAGPSEVQALSTRLDRLQRELPGIIVGVTNDGIQRRLIRS